MRIQFHGADRTVTGSCHIVETDSARILLDFGLYQGDRDVADQINAAVPDHLRQLDGVVLSHGHLDHCGRLPMLARAGYRGPIYCTPATADVARIVMLDAAKIQEENVQYLQRRSVAAQRRPARPLFTASDALAAVALFKRVPINEETELAKNLRFTFGEAGHILGSTHISVRSDERGATRSLLFTGDVGRYNSPILKDPSVLPGPFDAVITESTYGTVKHAPIEDGGPQLLAIIKTAIERRGRVIIPSFAVGRTQTILWYCQRFIQSGQLPEIPIFVDSPMGVEVSKVTMKYPDDYDEETRAAVCTGDRCEIFGASRVTFASSVDDSRAINRFNGACVIIASSPTCEFGRVLHHLKQSVENPADTIVFVGWTPPNTLGRRLQDGARHVRILDQLFDLRCTVRTLHGLSAHADGDELLRFLKPTLTRQTTAFVVHGESDRCDGFAARLSAAGVGSAIAPATNTVAIVGAAPVSATSENIATDE